MADTTNDILTSFDGGRVFKPKFIVRATASAAPSYEGYDPAAAETTLEALRTATGGGVMGVLLRTVFDAAP